MAGILYIKWRRTDILGNPIAIYQKCVKEICCIYVVCQFGQYEHAVKCLFREETVLTDGPPKGEDGAADGKGEIGAGAEIGRMGAQELL